MAVKWQTEGRVKSPAYQSPRQTIADRNLLLSSECNIKELRKKLLPGPRFSGIGNISWKRKTPNRVRLGILRSAWMENLHTSV
jgi:hypothetical protein